MQGRNRTQCMEALTLQSIFQRLTLSTPQETSTLSTTTLDVVAIQSLTIGNPTRSSLESCIAALEHGKYTITYSSGCAAMVAILNTLEKGAHVIVCDDVYGGT
jgi:cystathionine beta-lyase/cystathionine gamma-synthase